MKKGNVMIASFLADRHGYVIDLLDNPDDRKSADSHNHTLGVDQEYKLASTPTTNAIDRLIRDGRKQADNIVIWIDVDMPLGDIRNGIKDRMRRADNIKTLTLIIHGKDATYTREEILEENWKIKQADFR